MKASKRKPKPTLCAHCGAPDPATVDHVPPKNLFSRPLPSNLITVPSCWDCNAGASEDDEYFRLMLSLRSDVREEGARWAAESAMRSLARAEGQGLLRLLLSTIEEVDLRSPAGIYLGRSGLYKPDMDRLYRVVSRTVRGLFYDERGYPLPQRYNVRTHLLPDEGDIDRLETSVGGKAIEIARAVLLRPGPRIIGRNELRYWWQAMPEDQDATAWVAVFYQRIAFLTLAVPPQPAPSGE